MNRLKKSTLWYKLYRRNVLSKVNSSNFSEAKTQLDDIANQHDIYVSKIATPLVTTNVVAIENSNLHHAKEHLDAFIIFPSELEQKQVTINVLEEV